MLEQNSDSKALGYIQLRVVDSVNKNYRLEIERGTTHPTAEQLPPEVTLVAEGPHVGDLYDFLAMRRTLLQEVADRVILHTLDTASGYSWRNTYIFEVIYRTKSRPAPLAASVRVRAEKPRECGVSAFSIRPKGWPEGVGLLAENVSFGKAGTEQEPAVQQPCILHNLFGPATLVTALRDAEHIPDLRVMRHGRAPLWLRNCTIAVEQNSQVANQLCVVTWHMRADVSVES